MAIDRRLFLLSVAASPLYAGPLVEFSADEGSLIEALCDQIIPADDMPGAVQAGVPFYIDKQLGGPLKRQREIYRDGIPRLQHACREHFGKSFTALAPAQRTEFLTRIEKGPDPVLVGFFALVVEHTMQGFYGSPKHGGNAGGVSWKMLDIEEVMGGHKH